MDKKEIVYTFNENDSVYVLTDIMRKKCGVHNGLATSITNALYRSRTADYKTLGKIKEALSTEEGKKEILKTKYLGVKGLSTLEETMKHVVLIPSLTPARDNAKERPSLINRVDTSANTGIKHHTPPAGYSYLRSVDGSVIIDMVFEGKIMKRVKVCEGGNTARLIYANDPTEEYGFDIEVKDGFLIVTDRKTKCRYFYNAYSIIEIHIAQYDIVIKNEKEC